LTLLRREIISELQSAPSAVKMGDIKGDIYKERRVDIREKVPRNISCSCIQQREPLGYQVLEQLVQLNYHGSHVICIQYNHPSLSFDTK